jgi:hypothetical protein
MGTSEDRLGQLTFQMQGLVSYRTMSGVVTEVPKRGKHYCEPRGYAAPPGTGPAGETCRTCDHYVIVRHAKTYPKCDLNRACWTGGRRSDILVSAAACAKWEKRR